MLLLMLCTFFKGLFALFCHFFKGLLVAKIQNFLLKRERKRQLFLFQKESLFFLYPNLVFLTPICLLFSEFLLNFVQKSKRCRLWQQNSIL